MPPGQYLTNDFPVLSAGPTPHTPLAEWSFRIEGLVKEPVTWSWEEFNALPSRDWTVDISCVTKWTKLDMRWHGVSVDTLLEPSSWTASAAFVIAFCDGGYTTNLPIADVVNDQAFVAYGYDGASTGARAWRPGAPRRAPPLLLEERQMGARPAHRRAGSARILGVVRLPQPRRPLARRALQRRLSARPTHPIRLPD